MILAPKKTKKVLEVIPPNLYKYKSCTLPTTKIVVFSLERQKISVKEHF